MSLPKGLRANYSYQTNQAQFGVLGEVGKYAARKSKAIASGASDLAGGGFNAISNAVSGAGKTAATKGSNLAGNVRRMNNPQGLVGSVGKGVSDNLTSAGNSIRNNADAITKGGLAAAGAGVLAGGGALGANVLGKRRREQGEFSFAAEADQGTANFYAKRIASKAVDAVQGIGTKVAKKGMRVAKGGKASGNKLQEKVGVSIRNAGSNVMRNRDAAKKIAKNTAAVAGTGAVAAGGALALNSRKKKDADFGMRAFNKSLARGVTFVKNT